MNKRAIPKAWVIISVFLFTLGCSISALAQCEMAKLLPSDGEASDYFGIAVDIWDDVAVVRSNSRNEGLGYTGYVYVFRFDGSSWVEETKLQPFDVSYFFGKSVAIYGDTILIGANGEGRDGSYEIGAAYVFRFDDPNWVQEDKLLASDGASGDLFGVSVAISGDAALVGAMSDDDNGYNSGSAYIFRFDGTGWVEEDKLVASDVATGALFGHSSAIWGDIAVVGAYYDNENGFHSGAAYVFRFDGSNWVQETKLLASDGAAYDDFGYSVAVYGDTIIIGGHWDDDNGSGSGSAYVFRFDDPNWVEETKLLASDGEVNDHFGCSVAIFGDTIVIGAHGSDGNDSSSGAAYIFRFDGTNWIEEAKLVASDGTSDDYFGYSVDVFGDTAVTGAREDDDNGYKSGSAYIFAPQKGDCDGDCGVNFVDFAAFAAQWQLEVLSADIALGNKDGIVDLFDWAVFAKAWQSTGEPQSANWDEKCDIAPDGGNGVVDIDDLAVFVSQWLQFSAYCADIAPEEGDGVVNMLDLAVLADNWLEGVE